MSTSVALLLFESLLNAQIAGSFQTISDLDCSGMVTDGTAIRCHNKRTQSQGRYRIESYVTPPIAEPPTAAAPAIIIGIPATAPAMQNASDADKRALKFGEQL